MREEILRLHYEGFGQAAIAKQVRVTVPEVRAVLMRAGITRRANRTATHLAGGDLADPNRADRLLRRFSWES